jgi:hypothetical protein
VISCTHCSMIPFEWVDESINAGPRLPQVTDFEHEQVHQSFPLLVQVQVIIKGSSKPGGMIIMHSFLCFVFI